MQASQDVGLVSSAQVMFANRKKSGDSTHTSETLYSHRIFSINSLPNQTARFDQNIWRINRISRNLSPETKKIFSSIGPYFFYAISKPASNIAFDVAKFSTNTKSVYSHNPLPPDRRQLGSTNRGSVRLIIPPQASLFIAEPSEPTQPSESITLQSQCRILLIAAWATAHTIKMRVMSEIAICHLSVQGIIREYKRHLSLSPKRAYAGE